MKKVLIALFVLFCLQLTAQTDGISYQAVIIGPDNQELPGVDAEGNILPNATISIRFTILREQFEEYQEEQTTNTDQYGRINLLIGQVHADLFKEIDWDGRTRYLKVEIDFEGGTNYIDMARERLTYLPYSKHRNVTVSDTLTVELLTFLNGELQVQGPTNLNSTLNVNGENATNLSGDLNVDGITMLNKTLNVNNMFATNLSGALSVGNTTVDEIDANAPTNLAGILNVNGLGTFKDGISVTGTSTFDNLNVKNNTILGTLLGDGSSTSTTDIYGKTDMNGQVTIRADIDNMDTVADSPGDDVNTNQNNYSKYPLRVEGSYQGIAISVNESRGRANNYISFWDSSNINHPTMWGRIEGQNLIDRQNDPQYIREVARTAGTVSFAVASGFLSIVESIFGGFEVTGAATSSTACGGVGACITSPIPSLISVAVAKWIIRIAKAVKYGIVAARVLNETTAFWQHKTNTIGVTYASGAGDYAEYLTKENKSDDFVSGELVGIKNGLVSKDVWGSEKIMIVSTNPIILGNMPQPNNELNTVKIAFMGQVPVKVLGKVEPGDYIIPNLFGSGFARAVHPKDMKTKDFKRVAGVAWNVIDESDGINTVNVAVGINTNDLTDVLYQQEEELKALEAITKQLQAQIEKSNIVLTELVPGYAEAIGVSNILESTKNEENIVENNKSKNYEHFNDGIVYSNDDDIIYFKIPRELIVIGIEQAREVYLEALDKQKGMNKMISNTFLKSTKIGNAESIEGLEKADLVPIKDHPFWQKMDNDPAYKEEIIELIISSSSKAYHTHRKYANNFTEFKIKKN